MKCDVLILGGGGAGIAAAMAAARQGAHTMLVERNGSLGGMVSAALVHSVCGLYLLREEPGAIPAHPGLPTEIANRLVKEGASSGPVRMGRLDVLPHSPPGFAAMADALTAECKSLEVCLHTELIGIQGVKRVDEVEVMCRGARISIEPNVIVDASGDAILAALSGTPYDQADALHLQRPAFIFSLHSVDVLKFDDEARIRLAAQLAATVHDDLLTPGALGAQFRATGRGTEVYVTIDLAGPEDYDPTSPSQLARLEQTGRLIAGELTRFLRKSVPAFAHAEIAAFPTRVGVRESRRIRGVATVSAEDVLRGHENADVVALGTWPMELREKATGPRWRFPENLRPTQIPLGALKASAIENLWAAGRCISCEHEAQAALRVIGTCMATGQAAGVAAALQATRRTIPTAQEVRDCIELQKP